jgi:hypothetical protein
MAVDAMNEFCFDLAALIPEQPDIRFYTTGHCGGDAGHGGETFVKLAMPHGGSGFTVVTEDEDGKTQRDEVRSVSVGVYGDWEYEGMARAFIGLGLALLAERDRWTLSGDGISTDGGGFYGDA